MTAKTKSLFLLITTLLIGCVIGLLASGLLRQQREERVARMLPRERFRSFLQQVIQPTEGQKKRFEEISEKWSEELSELHREHQNEILAIYDSLQSDLSSVLTEEQKGRLREELIRGGGKLIEQRMERLARALELTEEQQKQMKTIMTSALEFEPPGPGEGPPGNWREGKRHARNHFEEIRQQIEEILTPEQLEKFRLMQHELPPPIGKPFRRRPGGPPPH